MPKYNKYNQKRSVCRTINYDILSDNLKEDKWDSVYSNTNIDELFNTFYEKLLNSIEGASSLKKENSKNK